MRRLPNCWPSYSRNMHSNGSKKLPRLLKHLNMQWQKYRSSRCPISHNHLSSRRTLLELDLAQFSCKIKGQWHIGAKSNQPAIHQSHERESMTIALAVIKWRPYLLGQHFVVRTDRRILKYLLDQRVMTKEHQTWLIRLLGYNFETQYKPGLENKVADAL